MVTTAGAPTGASRVVDPVGPPANRTVSEGIGYGLLIAVYMADKTLFDQLWSYASAHMPNGLMSWQIDSTGALVGGDTHSATDADEDMAWALLMADKQWGGTYLSTATTLIRAIKSEEVAGSGLLQGGDFTGGATYPDYGAPDYYAGFAAATGDATWTSQVFTAEYSQLLGAQNGQTGLVPDTLGGSTFGYDAVRAPWRVGIDFCWHGSSQAQTFLGKIDPYFVNIAAQSTGVKGLMLPIPLAGGTGSDPSGTINGPAAVGAMMSASNQTFIDQSWTYLMGTIIPQTSSASVIGPNYFSCTLGMLSVLMMGGDFVDYTNPAP